MKFFPFLFVVLAAQSPALMGQGGPLAPPGAPAPTMKSLDVMEPRVPLVGGAPGVSIAGSGTIAIGLPGSYYLAGNLTVTSSSGIIIGARTFADRYRSAIQLAARPAGPGAKNRPRSSRHPKPSRSPRNAPSP